jgi:Pyruvate/2-oxoacid:ferredoxin oxidoreductase delta subunit
MQSYLKKMMLEMQTFPMQNASRLRRFSRFFYMLIGRRGIGKLFLVNTLCGNCRLCIDTCPNKAVKLRFGKPFWTFKCKGCLVCAALCPHKSIEVSPLRFITVIVLLFLPYDTWFETIADIKFEVLLGKIPGAFVSLVIWGIGYAAGLFVVDRFLFFIQNLPFTEKIRDSKLVKKIRTEINPLVIFPVIVPKDRQKKV